MSFLLPLLAKYWKPLAGVFIVAVVLGVTYWKGYSSGSDSRQPEIDHLKAAVATQNSAVDSLKEKSATEDRSAKKRVSDSLSASQRVRESELSHAGVGPDELNAFMERTFP